MKAILERWEKFTSPGFPVEAKKLCKVAEFNSVSDAEIYRDSIEKSLMNGLDLYEGKSEECEKSFYYDPEKTGYHFWHEIKKVDLEYIGLVLDEESRQKILSQNSMLPENSKVYLHHMTMLHVSQLKGNEKLYQNLLKQEGKKKTINLISWGVSDKAWALFVEKDDWVSKNVVNEKPHVTFLTIGSGKPVDSNYIKDYAEFSKPIKVTGTITVVK